MYLRSIGFDWVNSQDLWISAYLHVSQAFLIVNFVLNSVISVYRIMPHTKNVSLADIERHFSSKQHKWTDWNIGKTNYTE